MYKPLMSLLIRFLTGKKEALSYYSLEILFCDKKGDIISEAHEVYNTDKERAQHVFVLTHNITEKSIIAAGHKCDKNMVGENVILLKYKEGFYRISYHELHRMSVESKIEQLNKAL